MGQKKKGKLRQFEHREARQQASKQTEKAPSASREEAGLDSAEILQDARLAHPANLRQRGELLQAGQQRLGNQAVQRLLQAKRTVSVPGDPYEREADRLAEKVLRMPEPALQRQEEEEEDLIQTSPLPTALQRQEEEEEEEEEEPIQAKGQNGPGGQITPAQETLVDRAIQGSGQSMPASERAFFEPRLGRDLGEVRIHTGSEAAQAAQSLQAQAFTSGQDIVFGEGRYTPETRSGRQLLAHELTHVLQQSGHEGNPSASSASVIQRHAPDGGCSTPEMCELHAAWLRRHLETAGAAGGLPWPRVWSNMLRENVIQSMTDEEAISVRIMLGEFGDNADPELLRTFQRLQPAWRRQLLRQLRQRTAAYRREQGRALEEEPEESEETAPETEEAAAPETEEATAPTSGLPPLRGEYPPLEGPSGPTSVPQVQSGGETFRVGDRSGDWQITAIERDWRGVHWMRIRNASTRQERSETLSDWRVRTSIHHVIHSTAAMGAIAEAEMAILREVFPGYIRIPAEIAWMAFILHQYHAQIENVIGQLSQLNPALDWLNQNTPTCVQVFVVGIASESAGREIPTTMNPVEVGRDIGRTIRDLRGLARVILSLVRFARGSAAAGVTAGFRIFLQLGGPIAERVPQFLQRIRFVRRIVQALDLVSPIDQAAQHVARGISTIESTPRQVQQRMEGDIRQESIARIGEALGLSHEDPRIDQLIRELTNEETATRLIGVLNTFRDLINLCTTLTDAIDHQRPSPTSSGESGGG